MDITASNYIFIDAMSARKRTHNCVVRGVVYLRNQRGKISYEDLYPQHTVPMDFAASNERFGQGVDSSYGGSKKVSAKMLITLTHDKEVKSDRCGRFEVSPILM